MYQALSPPLKGPVYNSLCKVCNHYVQHFSLCHYLFCLILSLNIL